MDSETAANAETIASRDAPPAVPDAQAEIQKVLKGIESDIDCAETEKSDLQEQIDKLDGDYRAIEEIAEEIAKWETGTAAEMRHAQVTAEIEAASWRFEAGRLETKLAEMDSLATKRGASCTEFRKQIARMKEEIRDSLPEEGDRQMIILAMAELSFRRPGWTDTARRIAATLHGGEMFHRFRETSADQIQPIPLPEKDREPMVECPACEAWETYPKREGKPCPICKGSRKVPADMFRSEP